MMHVEYRIKLPDHEYVVAEKHKLIPSVYAACMLQDKFDPKKGTPVSYSGPTYIAIRSGKHDQSTAFAHGTDFDHLITIPEFKTAARTTAGTMKPVVICSVDGGPDENPRFENTMLVVADHFTKHDLDAIFYITNAPGRSAYGRCERRMAPLSRSLVGVILDHMVHGSHLDSQKKTTNPALEKENFHAAADVLASL